MTTITKERLLTIKQWRETYGPGSNVVLPAEEAEELARIALASIEADPVAWKWRLTSLFDGVQIGPWRVCLAPLSPGKGDGCKTEAIPLYTAPPVPVVLAALPENDDEDGHDIDYLEPSEVYALGRTAGWNACRAAMLQSGNFRENKNSSTNNFREIAETSTNYPVIPSEVLSAILKVARVRADFDDFDGDRRGIGDCLDEAEQELIVTINKYASQLAAEPIAPNDVREQTAIPQVPVTPDGWISCSERMPDDGQHVIILCDGAFVLYAQYRDGEFFDIVRNGDEFFETQSRNVTDWMRLPEPPQEVNRG
ncbi:DUF551 domain-containing protein [Escherichia coli]|nr:DUF551 domain-containing protein [Escherichia coli]EFM2141670.1 DUF551 domain-containing protein [Escherichia coli]